MPKMRGFMRGKPKIDDAEWAIAQMRTAARLGDLFPSDDPSGGKEKGARDKASAVEGSADPSTIVVGPGPWPGGPRPPIIVVGVSEIVSVLPKTGPMQPTIISATPPPTIISATPPTVVPTPDEPIVVAAGEPPATVAPAAADESIVPAKPIGLAIAGKGEPQAMGVMAEPHEVSPAKPIGVMARAEDVVGDDTWRLPEASPEPVPAFARAVPVDPGLPPAAHVFAKRPARDDEGDRDLASLVRSTRFAASETRPTSQLTSPAASATPGRVPRVRPVVARSQAGQSAATASPAPEARVSRPRSQAAPATAKRRERVVVPAVESVVRAATPEARPAPKPERVTETRPAPKPERVAEARPAPKAPPAAKPAARPAAKTAERARVSPRPAARPAAKTAERARVSPPPAAPPAAKPRPATRVRAASKPRSAAKTRSAGKTRSVPAAAPTAYCPYCAKLLDPAPTTSRRCDRCRQRIVVKRIDGTAVYLTEAAVHVFEAERRRVMASVHWARDRDRWLQHAAAAGAPAERMAQLAVARLSAEVVGAARKLYLNTVDRAFRSARGEHDWDEASRLRRDEAAVLYRFSGSPAQPPDEVVALFREGVAAELRGVGEIARDAELVSARCCDTCRGDDHLVVKITTELRAPRLPHAGCPRGLCRCHWDLATKDRLTMRRYLRRRPAAELRLAQSRGDGAQRATSVPKGEDQVG